MTFSAKVDRLNDLFMDVQEFVVEQGIDTSTMPLQDRAVYFVVDIHSVTINAGLAAWVKYRKDDEDDFEVKGAIQTFYELGLTEQAESLSRIFHIFREHNSSFPDDFDDQSYSQSIWDHQEEIFDTVIRQLGGLPGTGD